MVIAASDQRGRQNASTATPGIALGAGERCPDRNGRRWTGGGETAPKPKVHNLPKPAQYCDPGVTQNDDGRSRMKAIDVFF